VCRRTCPAITRCRLLISIAEDGIMAPGLAELRRAHTRKLRVQLQALHGQVFAVKKPLIFRDGGTFFTARVRELSGERREQVSCGVFSAETHVDFVAAGDNLILVDDQ